MQIIGRKILVGRHRERGADVRFGITGQLPIRTKIKKNRGSLFRNFGQFLINCKMVLLSVAPNIARFRVSILLFNL